MGAARISQAMAPRNGGVTNEAITRMRMVLAAGMSVRATIHPSGAATRQQTRLTDVAMVSVVKSGSRNAGSVNSVWKLASVALRARSVKANTASQAIGRMMSRHSPAANRTITTPDKSIPADGRRIAGADTASTVTMALLPGPGGDHRAGLGR